MDPLGNDGPLITVGAPSPLLRLVFFASDYARFVDLFSYIPSRMRLHSSPRLPCQKRKILRLFAVFFASDCARFVDLLSYIPPRMRLRISPRLPCQKRKILRLLVCLVRNEKSCASSLSF